MTTPIASRNQSDETAQTLYVNRRLLLNRQFLKSYKNPIFFILKSFTFHKLASTVCTVWNAVLVVRMYGSEADIKIFVS